MKHKKKKIYTYKKDTVIVTAGREPSENHGILNPPVYHASTISFPTIEEFHKKDDDPYALQYGRSGTPTTFAFEKAVTALHGGFASIAMPSGAAAIACAMTAFLKKGDHVLIADNVYGPTRQRVARHILRRGGVDVTFYDPLLGAKISELIHSKTKLIFMESPGSLTFEVQDVPAITEVAKKAQIITIIDNTWASPYLCQPINLGTDIVVEAATKYIVGHSDAMMGIITVTNDQLFRDVKKNANAYGYHAAPDDCYLAARGLRTLSVRLERHQKNALKVVRWLQSRDEIERVMYPALEDDPGHLVWKRDFSGASGLFGVVFKEGFSYKSFAAMINSLDLFPIGASWGGYESLLLPSYPGKVRTAVPWPFKGYTIRLHIGLENPDDLIADLEKGFRHLMSC